MINYKQIYSLLGLAEKAGKVKSGEFQTEQSVKGYRAMLVIIADDASDNTKKKFNDMCSYYKVPVYILGNKEDIGHCIGKEMRAMVAIEDQGFAKSIQKKIDILTSNSKDINQEDGEE